MKKIGLVALFALLLAGCDDGGEKKAQENLRKAEAALEKENFNEAKLQIDSIRILYPKAFEARKQGVKLMQQVDLKEQRKSLIYLDSMMVVKQAQLDSVKGNFVLEKDTAYQEVGNYFYPTQTVEKNTVFILIFSFHVLLHHGSKFFGLNFHDLNFLHSLVQVLQLVP